MSSLNTNTKQLWFNIEDSDEAAQKVLELGKQLWEKQGTPRISLAQDSLALYLGSSRHSLMGGGNPLALLDIIGNESSAFNVIQSITDTKINATLKNRVRTMWVTESADSETKRKTQAMQAACDGIAYQNGLLGWLRRARCTAGYLFEGGGVEWYADHANKRVVATLVYPWEWFVSAREARLGNPRQLWARHTIDRAVLLSFMDNASTAVKEAIANAQPASARDTYDDLRDPKGLSDQVVIYKAWHLPSGRVDLDDPRSWGVNEETGRKVKPPHDGRHIVALDTGSENVMNTVALVDVPWPHDIFPVSWFKPNPVPGSWWSRGEPEVLAPAQIELNRWSDREARIIKKHAVPRTFVDKKSGLNPGQMTNAIDNIYLVNGAPSQAVFVEAAPHVPPDLFRRTGEIAENARNQRGISEMSAFARKPTSVNHEPGMAYLADTETVRHTSEFEAWEECHLNDYKNIIRCLRELAKKDPDYEVVFEQDKLLRREKWADIDLGNVFQIKGWPTNWLKEDPAQRADQISDLVEKGVLPPEALMDAIDDPDLESLIGYRIAMANNLTRLLDRIVEDGDGEMEMPTPYMDLQMAKRLGIQRLNELQANEPDSFSQQNEIIKFLEDVDAEIAKATAPAANQQGAGDTLGALGPGAAAPPPGAAQAPPPAPPIG